MVASCRLMRATSLSATRSVTPGMLISRFRLSETGFISTGRVAHIPESSRDKGNAVSLKLTFDEPAVSVADLVVEGRGWHGSVLQTGGGR